MTMQQMLLTAGARKPVEFVGVSSVNTGNSRWAVCPTPAGTEPGDLLLMFANSTNGGAHSWDASTSPSIIELADAAALPNLWCGYAISTGGAGINYQIESGGGASSNTRLIILAYRNATIGKAGAIAKPGNVSSTVLSMAQPGSKATIVGCAVFNGGNATWSVVVTGNTVQQTKPWTQTAGVTPQAVIFERPDVSADVSFTVSGMGTGNATQGMLVSLTPA